MIKVECLDKIRDNNGKIVTYVLRDCKGQTQRITPYVLKNKIIYNEMEVTNLKLTSDGRLIDSKESKDAFPNVRMLDLGTSDIYSIVQKEFNNSKFKYKAEEVNGSIIIHISRYNSQNSEQSSKDLADAIIECLDDLSSVVLFDDDKSRSRKLKQKIVFKAAGLMSKVLKVKSNGNMEGVNILVINGKPVPMKDDDKRAVLQAVCNLLDELSGEITDGKVKATKIVSKEESQILKDNLFKGRAWIANVNTVIVQLIPRLLRNNQGGYMVEYDVKVRFGDVKGKEITGIEPLKVYNGLNAVLDVAEHKLAVNRFDGKLTSRNLINTHTELVKVLKSEIEDVLKYGYTKYDLNAIMDKVMETSSDPLIKEMRDAALQRL